LRAAGAASLNHTASALIETFLEGPQYSVEIVLPPHGAEPIFLNAVLRPFAGVVELGHINPAPLTEAARNELFELATRVGITLGVTGIFKVDVIWPEGGGPEVLECTARLSGGWDSSHTTPLATGRDFAALALYLAVTPNPAREGLVNFARARRHRTWAACATIFLPPGHRVTFLTPEDVWVRWRAKPGDVIGPVGDCGERAGFAFAVADDPTLAWRLALEHAEHVSRTVRLEPVEE
jgi:biotin carboxylase